MNLETSYLNRYKYDSYKSQNKVMSDLGFIGYKRIITIFMKESKNMNGIIGHNLVTKINCLITNYSVSKLNNEETLFNKTVYICDIDFPSHLKMDYIKENLNEVIHSAIINPIYAFSTSHIEKIDGSYIDLGLSMIDLSICDRSQFAITNFSDNKGNDPKFKELIYSNHYNPKYYTKIHAEYNENKHESRKGIINEFIDNNTNIVYNTKDSETVDHFINNVQKTGIYINKKTILVSEMITDLFNKLLFISMDRLEFIIDTTNKNSIINIKELKFFSKFNESISEFYCQEIYNNIIETIYEYYNKFKEDFYLVCRFDEQFVIIDIHFFKDNKEIRLTKPIYKLYGEFSLNNEEIMNELEYHGEYVKTDLIDQYCRNSETLGLENSDRMIRNAIAMVDDCTRQVQMLISESATNRQLMIQDDVWAEKEKYLLNHKQ